MTSFGHGVADVSPDVFDVGADYPSAGIETARRLVADPASIGVVIGGSGNGEQISANEVAGYWAALAWSTESARLVRAHHDAQVIGVGARMHGPDGVAQIGEAFLALPLSGGERHARQTRMISDFEATGDAPLIFAG